MLLCAPHLLLFTNRSKAVKICLFRVRLLVTSCALLLIVPPASRVAWSTEGSLLLRRSWAQCWRTSLRASG